MAASLAVPRLSGTPPSAGASSRHVTGILSCKELRDGRASQVTPRTPMYATNEIAPPPRSLFEKLFVRPYEVRHRRLLWGFRIVWGFVLLGLAMVALSYGSWWALWFLAGAAADFFFGYRIYQIAQRQPPT
jgi:hypothetical protein